MRRAKRTILILAGLAMPMMILAIHRAQAVSDGPQPIAWDQEACAECHMLISERGFAAQLQTTSGQTLNFDDPACLMMYVARQHPSVRAVYFRDSESTRWLRSDEAAFVRSAQSPMGRGLEAVSSSRSGALSFAQALREIEQGGRIEGK
jgi:copper chaperone NosL